MKVLTIGEFSKLSMVTKKTLRHYDKIGLIKPTREENGYRYYHPAQLRDMRLILRLKDYGFTLIEIAGVLARPGDDAYLLSRLTEIRGRLISQRDTAQNQLLRLEEDLENIRKGVDIMKPTGNIEVKQLSPMRVFSLRKHIAMSEFGAFFEEAFQGVKQAGLEISGPAVAMYHDDDFNPEHSDIELGFIVTGEGPGAHMLDLGLCAILLHKGAYDRVFSDNYALMAQWITENGYRLCGPVMDMYIRSVNEEGLDPSEYITQICFPVKKA